MFVSGDQILDVNGIELAGRSIAEISEIIRSSPEIVVCTVKPVTDFRVVDSRAQAEKRADYAELDLSSLKTRECESSSGSAESLSDSSHPRTDSGGSEKNAEEKKAEKEQQYNEEVPQYAEVIPKNLRSRSVPNEGTNPGDLPQRKDLNYSELAFPVYDRPRTKSDTPAKQQNQQEEQKPVGPIQAYAYIELDFKDKNELQEPLHLRNEQMNKENVKS